MKSLAQRWHIGIAGFVLALGVLLPSTGWGQDEPFPEGLYKHFLFSAFHVFNMPETTPEQMQLKIDRLLEPAVANPQQKAQTIDHILDAYIKIMDRPRTHELDSDIVPWARFMEDCIDEEECQDGRPQVVEGWQQYKYPYRPQIFMLYGDWLAATLLARLPETERHDLGLEPNDYYLAAVSDLKHDTRNFALYQQPAVLAMLADCYYELHDYPALLASLQQWAQARKHDLNGWLDIDDIEDCREITEAHARFFADQFDHAHDAIYAKLQQAILDSLHVSQLQWYDDATTLAFSGHNDGVLPFALWAEDDNHRKLSEMLTVNAGSDFSLPIYYIDDNKDGNVHLCWALSAGASKTKAFLHIAPAKSAGIVPDSRHTYTARALIRNLKLTVPEAGQPYLWMTSQTTWKNREALVIHYTWNKKFQGKTFTWLIERKPYSDDIQRQQSLEGSAFIAKPIDSPQLPEKQSIYYGPVIEPLPLAQQPDMLSIPVNTLPRGVYALWVKQDPTKETMQEVFRFRVSLPGVALVVGISNYAFENDLIHPCKDASDIVARLRKAGYSDDEMLVVLGDKSGLFVQGPEQLHKEVGKEKYYATHAVLTAAHSAFAALIDSRKPAHALFYYAGHGGMMNLNNRPAVEVLNMPTDQYSDEDYYDLTVFTD